MPKSLKTRIQNKHDIEANWLLASNFVPLAGEIIIYDPDETHDLPRVKIGDGETLVNNLKFIDADIVDALGTKADAEHGTHVSFSSNTPVMDGIASAGSAGTVARSDHKHPTDTSRASQADFAAHKADSTHITAEERSNWDDAKRHADAQHAPVDAEKNQNAFSSVVIGDTTITADTSTDSLTLVAGTNVSLTPDVANDKITITATDTTYSAGNGISMSGTTINNAGVRSISTGIENGTISVNTAGTSANVAVKGLGSAAYTDASAYDTAGSAAAVADKKADKEHTHLYAASDAIGGSANSAKKLTASAGSGTQPVFFENGVPKNTTYTLGKSVPADAKFTDTVYTHPSYTAKAAGLYKVTVDNTGHVSSTAAVAKSDITALGIPAQDTTYSTGTATSSGLTKLYTDTGNNTDGTMTQKAITSAFDNLISCGTTDPSSDTKSQFYFKYITE
jgi:hypothetical protein